MIMTHLDILVLVVVVALIFHKLKAILGTRPEEDGKKINISREEAESVINAMFNSADKQMELKPAKLEDADGQPEKVVNLSDSEKALAQIPNFNKSKFQDAAMSAFEIITEAFSKGDVETLEMLLSKSLFKKFQEVIEQRKADKIVAETDFICFDKVEIVDAKISKNEVAKIMVEFVSQQVNVLRDEKGEVIEGDEQFIQTITDVWTFERALSSTSPNWLLVSTKK